MPLFLGVEKIFRPACGNNQNRLDRPDAVRGEERVSAMPLRSGGRILRGREYAFEQR